VWDYTLSKNDSYTLDIVYARIKLAAESLLRENADIYEKLELVLEPSARRCIIAREKISKGELAIPPVAPTIQYTPSAKLPDACLDLGMTFTFTRAVDKPVVNLYITPKMPQTFTAAKVSGAVAADKQEFIAPFWLITCTSDQAVANCCIQQRNVDVLGVSVPIPVLVNTRVIKIGEQLFTHQKHGCSSKYPIDTPAAKKPRTS
jgi:hypothetical protein